MTADTFDFGDRIDGRFRALQLEEDLWAVFDIESVHEADGEPHIACWSGEAEDEMDAVQQAKLAWGL